MHQPNWITNSWIGTKKFNNSAIYHVGKYKRFCKKKSLNIWNTLKLQDMFKKIVDHCAMKSENFDPHIQHPKGTHAPQSSSKM
jgi:hypothetical protein